VIYIRLSTNANGQTTPWSKFTYDQRIGRHRRTPPDSKRGHPRSQRMAINSADIMTHTVTALKAQFDIDDFVHPDEKIHNSQHNRTPLQSKRGLLDDHVYNIMAINSADIMTYTASILKAQLDIFAFVHPVDGNIRDLLVPVEDKGGGKRVKLPHRLPPSAKIPTRCGTVGHRLSAQSEFDHQYATIQYPQRSTGGVKSSTHTTPQKQSRLPHNRCSSHCISSASDRKSCQGTTRRITGSRRRKERARLAAKLLFSSCRDTYLEEGFCDLGTRCSRIERALSGLLRRNWSA